MTDIEKKALALVNEVKSNGLIQSTPTYQDAFNAICRAIEQHEAFKQEVSDAVTGFDEYGTEAAWEKLSRFIIPKTDPVQDAIHELGKLSRSISSDDLRAALAARGLEVRKIGEGE